MTRTDEDIQHDVLDELEWDARVEPNEISVIVKNGVVTLTGWVDSFVQKGSAERAAQRVRGVTAVMNDIEVRLPAESTRSDPDIAAAANRALEWDAMLPPGSVTATASNGWVMLRGEVSGEYQKREAELAVRRLTGVRGVANLITVHPTAKPASAALKNNIRDALVRSAEADAGRIEVDVQGDTIVIEGKVRSWVERREAERVAWSAPGVTAVDNRIVVEP
jgi:osmotically-inducible protein OsmY